MDHNCRQCGLPCDCGAETDAILDCDWCDRCVDGGYDGGVKFPDGDTSSMDWVDEVYDDDPDDGGVF